MRDKTVNIYSATIQLASESYKRLKKYVIKLLIDAFKFNSIRERHKTQEMRERVTYEDPSILIYCSDRYKAQKMCNVTVDDCLAALNIITDWFVKS